MCDFDFANDLNVVFYRLDPNVLMIYDYHYLKKNGSIIKMFWMLDAMKATLQLLLVRKIILI